MPDRPFRRSHFATVVLMRTPSPGGNREVDHAAAATVPAVSRKTDDMRCFCGAAIRTKCVASVLSLQTLPT